MGAQYRILSWRRNGIKPQPRSNKGPWVLNAEYYPGSRQKLEENVHEQSKSKQQFSFRPYPNLITHKSNSHIGKESFHGCSIQNIAPEMEQHEASIQICTQATFPYWGGESMGAQNRILPQRWNSIQPLSKKTRKIIVHKPCFHIWKEVSPCMLNTEYCPRDGTALSVYPNLILQRVALHKPSSHIEKESDHGCSLQTIALEMERH